MFNPYSRCTCCDQVLTSRQPILSSTGEADDLCGPCRRIVKKAVHYHEEDVLSLETDVWCRQMGTDELLEASQSVTDDDWSD